MACHPAVASVVGRLALCLPGWPPQQPNLTLQMIAAIRTDPFIISEAAKGTYIEARNRRVLEDNRRQIAEAEQRQREFEKRRRKD